MEEDEAELPEITWSNLKTAWKCSHWERLLKRSKNGRLRIIARELPRRAYYSIYINRGRLRWEDGKGVKAGQDVLLAMNANLGFHEKYIVEQYLRTLRVKFLLKHRIPRYPSGLVLLEVIFTSAVAMASIGFMLTVFAIIFHMVQ